jgi:hypothetical protein
MSKSGTGCSILRMGIRASPFEPIGGDRDVPTDGTATGLLSC